jgi:N-acetylneuraminic acid mutarotase
MTKNLRLKHYCFGILTSVSVYFSQAQWNPLPDFPGGARDDAYGVSLENAMYLGGGRGSDFGFRSDFWKFENGYWSRLEDSPFLPRQYAQMAAFGDSVWVAGGSRQTEYYSDVWLFRVCP